MDPLKPEVVEEVLKENKRRPVPQGTNLFNTIRTPLFLYLFLKLKESNSPDYQLTEHGLYNLLWVQSIDGSLELNSGKVNHQRLLNLLDQITGKMYDTQSLTLSKLAIDSANSYERDYLLHEELLLEVSENRIQFSTSPYLITSTPGVLLAVEMTSWKQLKTSIKAFLSAHL